MEVRAELAEQLRVPCKERDGEMSGVLTAVHSQVVGEALVVPQLLLRLPADGRTSHGIIARPGAVHDLGVQTIVVNLVVAR